MELGELTLELPARAAAFAERAATRPADLLRGAVNDARVRAALISLLLLCVAAVSEQGLKRTELVALVATVAWTLAVQCAHRSLDMVGAVAGGLGVAAAGALGGAGIESTIGFWLPPAVPDFSVVIAMTALVFALVLAIELARTRIAVLRSRVLLVGGGEGGQELVRLLEQERRGRFSVLGVVDREAEASAMAAGIPWLGEVSSLQQVVEESGPDLVVVATERGRPEVFSQLANVGEPRFRVVGLPEFYEHAFGRVPVRTVTDAWFMSVFHLYQRSYTRVAKRTFDLVAALIILLATAPLFPLIALLVRCTGRPVFFRQTRLGEAGRPFVILKFRTMRQDAEAAGAVWAAESDPRITRVGMILRRTRLDEVPQLLNVLRGEMAIVGPRPERPEFQEYLEAEVPFWSRRSLLKPGITGWAQLRSGYAADARDTEEKLAHDLWYLRHQSLMVDLLICARTIPSLLLAAGR